MLMRKCHMVTGKFLTAVPSHFLPENKSVYEIKCGGHPTDSGVNDLWSLKSKNMCVVFWSHQPSVFNHLETLLGLL